MMALGGGGWAREPILCNQFSSGKEVSTLHIPTFLPDVLDYGKWKSGRRKSIYVRVDLLSSFLNEGARHVRVKSKVLYLETFNTLFKYFKLLGIL